MSGFSSLPTHDWALGPTEITNKLFDVWLLKGVSESSLLLAESLSAESEEEEGLIDSLGVFLSSPAQNIIKDCTNRVRFIKAI